MKEKNIIRNNMKSNTYLFLIFFFFTALYPFHVDAKTIIPAGLILGNVTLTEDGGPYVVDGPVVLSQGYSLTVEYGTVIKFAPGASFSVHGASQVNITGTPSKPVYFTSLKDDSVGGDSNGDGNATSPAPGDWGFISFGEGTWNNNMHLSHIKVRYGGGVLKSFYQDTGIYPALIIHYQWFSGSPGVNYWLSTVEVSQSAGVGFYTHVGQNNSVSVSGSSFYNNAFEGVRKTTLFGSRSVDQTGSLEVSNNWWGDSSGPYHPSLNPSGFGDSVFGTKLILSSWLPENPFPDAQQHKECCSSVVFLPGIKATELYENDNRVWLPGFFNTDAQRLEMTNVGESINELTVGAPIEDLTFASVKLVEVYGEFFDYLNSLKGNTIVDWKALPYDWRYDVFDVVALEQQLHDNTTLNLINEIKTLASNSATGKVAIITHSNGGLLGKALLSALGEDADLVDQFIMVGTPQLGTPQALGAFLHGQDQDLPGGSWPAFFLSQEIARQLSKNMPGAYALLPTGSYLEKVLDPLITFDSSSDLSLPYLAAYGDLIGGSSSQSEREKNDLYSFLLGIGDGRAEALSGDLITPITLNQTLLDQARFSRSLLEDWQPPESLEIIQIVGWGKDTVRGIEYKEFCNTGADCVLLPLPKFTAEGDGTVVWESAGALDAAQTYFFDLSEANNWDHTDLLVAPSVQELIGGLITRNEITPVSISKTKPFLENAGKRLRVSVHSPVSLGIRDSLGRFTGIIQNSDSSSNIPLIIEEIPGTYYTEFGEGKYIGMPDGSSFDFTLTGYDSGAFTLILDEVEQDTVVSSAIFKNIPITEHTIVNFKTTRDLNTLGTLYLDKNGDGVADYTLEPDLEKPVILPKAPITVMADSQIITLGEGIPILTYSMKGFVADETLETSDITGEPKCETALTNQSFAGQYPISCTIGTLRSDYYSFDSFVAGALTIKYAWEGFLQPIDDPAAQPGVMPSIFKTGSTVPVKLRLMDSVGNIVQGIVVPEWLSPIKGASLLEGVAEVISYDSATAGSAFRWDDTEQQYIYNWKTKGFDPGYWYYIFVQLNDGSVHSVKIGLK